MTSHKYFIDIDVDMVENYKSYLDKWTSGIPNPKIWY